MKDKLGNDTVTETAAIPSWHINDLPPEILIEIFCKLDLVQLNNFRLVCKYWHFIISNPSIWEKSFSRKFGVSELFPSFSHRPSWIPEYLGRVQNLKKWKKAEATHINYQVLNEIYLGDNEFTLASFASDRLLTYSPINNNVTICQLHNGKNQTFIPGNNHSIQSYAVNWSFLVFATNEGGLYIKNLITSTSSSGRSSIKEAVRERDEIFNAVRINQKFDKHHGKPDIIVGSNLGNVYLYNLDGDKLHHISLQARIIDIHTDFQKAIVNCHGKIVIINLNDYSLRTIESETGSHMDYDLVDNNIIITNRNSLTIINYTNEPIRSSIEFDEDIKFGKLQSCHKVRRDVEVVGKDGLFYAVVLASNNIVVLSIRDKLKVINKFHTVFKYKNLSTLAGDSTEVVSVAFNSSVIVVGGFNGFCNVHDLFTGRYLREVSTKYPKKYNHMFQYKLPVRSIKLNENDAKTDGIIVCGDIIQYFRMGEFTDDKKDIKKKVSVTENNSQGKKNVQKIIRDQLEDYDIEEHNISQLDQMFIKYNGDDYDSEDELSIAIALSESTSKPKHVHQETPLTTPDSYLADDEISRALELSKLETSKQEQMSSHEEEQLKRALEMSLLER